ncbi:uncharacterized protein MELLADRAFT_63264 [Melampsora larici-populina 98AG31]|uniref:Uncharacterized protein n=1 Tax=Melampsora larici-populina (strain 98AG31 / pathotype 3-4-7) TaxID=747676 RepID=F4RM07_MELLP|nr:uncharacterized protein MELLADRAFT_63264 [Melampsora larici-populina 98AG31]EGG06670.1 hypothetical protein MELLADRAFT_63264 [Melampsora larici-populina 98AG31]
MKTTLKDKTGPTFYLYHSRKKKLLSFKLSTLLLLTMVMCEKMLVMALPPPFPSFKVASSSVDIASMKSANGIKDITKGLDTVKSTDGVLESPKVIGMLDELLNRLSQSPHHKLIIYPIKDPSTDLKNVHSSLNWITKLKNRVKKFIQSFPNPFKRMKGKQKPLEDTLDPSRQGFKPILIKTAAKPNFLRRAKLVLARYYKSWSVMWKNVIKKRAERQAIRKRQSAFRLEAAARDWYRSLPPQARRGPRPRLCLIEHSIWKNIVVYFSPLLHYSVRTIASIRISEQIGVRLSDTPVSHSASNHIAQ